MAEPPAPDTRAPVTARQSLSVVIPTLNVEAIIGRCLEALRWVDEVVVVDMFSTDRTQEICESYPNVWFLQRRDYIFANVNYGMEVATGDWVMRLDSDEVLTPELGCEIQEEVLARPDAPYNTYWVPSRVYFWGKWLKFGPAYNPRAKGSGYDFRKILFRKGTARYPVKSEHEDISAAGPYGWLEHPYDHYSMPTVSAWVAKMNYYTDRDVERKTPQECAAVRFAPRPFLWRFLRDFMSLYLRRQGYRDGAHGLAACFLHAVYPAVETIKTWERQWKQGVGRWGLGVGSDGSDRSDGSDGSKPAAHIPHSTSSPPEPEP
jgi:glycosyltransferase involved in cell wall biosynthesis